jgi:transposase InsO family protein/molybdopterin converting factor small subunit
MHRTDALTLSLETNDDSAQLTRPSRDRRLPARYRTGDFVSTDTPHVSLRPLLANASRIAPTPRVDTQDSITVNNNNNNTNTNTVNNNNNNIINNNNTVSSNTNTNIDINDTVSIIPQVSDTSDTDSTSNDTTPVKFSSSDKANKADAEIERIRQYLLSRRAPSDLSADALTRFISRAHRFLIAEGRLWRRQQSGRHQLYARPSIRYALVRDAHDKLGHKGFYSTRRTLLDRFWWPALETDVKWFVQTCHQCQIRQTTKVHLPPTVVTPATLFQRVHIDTMHMPSAGGYRYIVQARCSLTAWPEWRALRVETGRTVGTFIFEEILCRWGAVEQLITDNGTPYVAALDWLADRYGIRHIRISAYNSQANGVVERQHRTVRESIFKACDGDNSRWPTVAPFAFWADRATTRKSTGHSPFFMVHGVEPILPFDLVQATFLVPDLTKPLSTRDLLAIRARQLQKRPADLAAIHDRILASRHASIRQFEKQYANTIRDFDFAPGSLVLVRNTNLGMDKMKPRYLGPMVVLRRSRNGAYRLGELDGAVSSLRYAAFRLIPYYARSQSSIPVTQVVDSDRIASIEYDDTSLRGAGSHSDDDESTQEG